MDILRLVRENERTVFGLAVAQRRDGHPQRERYKQMPVTAPAESTDRPGKQLPNERRKWASWSERRAPSLRHCPKKLHLGETRMRPRMPKLIEPERNLRSLSFPWYDNWTIEHMTVRTQKAVRQSVGRSVGRWAEPTPTFYTRGNESAGRGTAARRSMHAFIGVPRGQGGSQYSIGRRPASQSPN